MLFQGIILGIMLDIALTGFFTSSAGFFTRLKNIKWQDDYDHRVVRKTFAFVWLGSSSAKSAPRSLRRALLMPQVNTESPYRCGKRA